MKIAVLSESSADESALRILVDEALGIRSAGVDLPSTLRVRGWPSVRNVLPAVIRFLHYRTDADGLVLVVDSNHSPFAADVSGSRLFDLKQIAQNLLTALTPVPPRPALRVAVGIACPAIEAWLLSHRRSNINENEWQRGLSTEVYPYTKLQLKKHLYGVERPSLQLETEKMVEAAIELSPQISLLEIAFPVGFGTLAAELRSWRRVG